MTSKADPTAPPEPLSLKRWARRKLDSARTQQQGSPPASAPPSSDGAAPALPDGPGTRPAPAELPPVESLTPESDFTAFFQPQGKVDETLKRAALKQLFRDPQFNVMDGLDIYVGDYTQSDPIPDGVLERLVQARAIFNPPKTMLTPEGHVVDVPPDAATLAPEEPPTVISHAPAERTPPLDAIDPAVAGDDRKTGETS